jgi:hypothetical protein
MTIFRRPFIQFGLASFAASLPICAVFWGFEVQDNTFGPYLWHVLPAVALVASALAAWVVSHFTAPQGFGFWRGLLAALLALVACCAVAHPALILPALVVVGWLVAMLGGLAGWLIGRQALRGSA